MELVIKKILYATDLSKNSAYAFQYAVDYAESTAPRSSSCMFTKS